VSLIVINLITQRHCVINMSLIPACTQCYYEENCKYQNEDNALESVTLREETVLLYVCFKSNTKSNINKKKCEV
jgi:hypothetical protein